MKNITIDNKEYTIDTEKAVKLGVLNRLSIIVSVIIMKIVVMFMFWQVLVVIGVF